MPLSRVLPAILVPICWVLAALANDAKQTTAAGTTPTPKTETTAAAGPNGTTHVLSNGFNVDSSMIQRALYVLIGITMIGVLYFLIRAVRLKKPTQRKKYGLLSNHDDSVEMEAVESDEDDTLYEARSLRR